ncbi:5368_t:CDS:2, partial [Dentiscutata erythropus]
MSDSTSEDKFDSNNDIIFEEKEVDSPNSVENEKNAVTTMSLPQEEQIEDDKVIARLYGKCEQKFSPTTTTGPYGRGDTQYKKECFDAILNLVVCYLIHFEHNHMAISIKEKLYELCNTINISDKVIILMTDSHMAMVLCGSIIEQEWDLQKFKVMRNELSLLVTAYKKQLETDYLNDNEWEVVDNM